MRIQIEVYLPHASYIRKDVPALGAWDSYGCAEELDYSLPKFAVSNFASPTKGVAAKSTANGYSWGVIVASLVDLAYLQVNQYPTILFYDVDAKKYVGKIEGAPKERGVVEAALKSILATASQPTGGTTGATGATKLTPTQAGLGLAALLLLLVKKKSVQD